jgi:ParB family transcriptional regulator, chromosome partitioning protein
MSVADNFKKRFGANMQESLGARPTPSQPEATPAGPAQASPDAGRSRARETGHMEIVNIVADPNQPRKEFDQDSLDRLATSMKERGQLLPIRVRWNQELGKWIVISGERRFRAAAQAGFKTVSCIFIDRDLTPAEILQEQLIENLIREDLKPVEQARGFHALMEANGWGTRDLAIALHISPAAISKAMALLNLPGDVQQQVDAGDLPPSVAYEVAKLPDEDSQREMAGKAVKESMTRDKVVEEVRARKGSKTGNKPRGKTAGKSRNTVCTFDAGDAQIVVSFDRQATDAEITGALEDALGQSQARVPGPRLAA